MIRAGKREEMVEVGECIAVGLTVDRKRVRKEGGVKGRRIGLIRKDR